MTVTSFSGIPLEYFVHMGKIPPNLKWNGEIPHGYSVNLIKNATETRTIIVCTANFGGRISYAVHEGDIDVFGSERALEGDEVRFIVANYPELYKAIQDL